MKYRKQLKINEIFYSIQGEGYHSGQAAIFIRFAECNLACSFCDTEFLSGKVMDVQNIVNKVLDYPKEVIVILTGGEPTLYHLGELVMLLNMAGRYVAIETNGLREIDLKYSDMQNAHLDWVCVSPKTDWRKIKINCMNEVKYIIENGSKLPFTDWIRYCDHYWISPMNDSEVGKNDLRTDINEMEIIPPRFKAGEKSCTGINNSNIKYCVDMVKSFPKWKLNLQIHKIIGVE